VSVLNPRRHVLLAALAIGAFAIGLDAFVVIGSLSEIIQKLEISSHAGGWIVSSYAFCYALFAPLNAWLFRGWSRRSALVLSVALFTVGNLTCALAPGFPTLIAGRVLSAFGAAMFTPAATTLATELLPAQRKGFALSLIFGGMTVSQAAGVPVTSWVSEQFGWRYAFHFVVFFGLVSMALLAILLAGLPSVHTASERPRRAQPLPGMIYGLWSVTLMIVTAEFSVYSYISLLVDGTTLAGASVLPALLLAYGIGAIVGNAATGVLTDRIGPAAVLFTAVSVQTALLAALVLLRAHGLAVVGISFAWGIVSYMYLVPIQHRLLSWGSERSTLVLAVNSSLIYIGIGIGSWIGGLILDAIGLEFLVWATVGIGSLALVAAIIFMRQPVAPRADAVA
jgi:DHA1 family inner membrane transport protein